MPAVRRRPLDVAAAPHPREHDEHTVGVRLRLVPPAVAAATRFRGRWSAANYRKHLERLRTALRSEGLSPVGPPRFARFDPPYKPWFLRRNEIVLSLQDPAIPPSAPGENR